MTYREFGQHLTLKAQDRTHSRGYFCCTDGLCVCFYMSHVSTQYLESWKRLELKNVTPVISVVALVRISEG